MAEKLSEFFYTRSPGRPAYSSKWLQTTMSLYSKGYALVYRGSWLHRWRGVWVMCGEILQRKIVNFLQSSQRVFFDIDNS